MRKKVTNNTYEIDKSVSTIMQTPGGLKRLSAAIFVAANVTGTGTNRVVTPRTPEEMKKIQRIVQGALGIQEGADALRPDQIAVEEMPFNDQFPVEAVQQFEKEQQQQFWWDLAKNAVYPVLAVAVLVLFWRTIKRMPTDTIPIGVPIGKITGNGNGRLHGNGHGQPEAGTVTVDVLNQLIRENPNNMTQAIRSWMSAGKGN
jgi:flagellar M-ring protein FliF